MNDDSPQSLYRFFATDGSLLYIGITDNLTNRLKGHNRSQPWWTEVATVSVQHFDSRAAVEVAEKAAIKSERPRYNRKDHPAYVHAAGPQMDISKSRREMAEQTLAKLQKRRSVTRCWRRECVDYASEFEPPEDAYRSQVFGLDHEPASNSRPHVGKIERVVELVEAFARNDMLHDYEALGNAGFKEVPDEGYGRGWLDTALNVVFCEGDINLLAHEHYLMRSMSAARYMPQSTLYVDDFLLDRRYAEIDGGTWQRNEWNRLKAFLAIPWYPDTRPERRPKPQLPGVFNLESVRWSQGSWRTVRAGRECDRPECDVPAF